MVLPSDPFYVYAVENYKKLVTKIIFLSTGEGVKFKGSARVTFTKNYAHFKDFKTLSGH